MLVRSGISSSASRNFPVLLIPPSAKLPCFFLSVCTSVLYSTATEVKLSFGTVETVESRLHEFGVECDGTLGGMCRLSWSSEDWEARSASEEK
ncbi:hypothetical protein BaRGS_00009664 [Batillaria attramentaria]|uniref:Uncharacterized protein n=1 Tax=Batillaria attramentaria TaxID=370345 RepID=A0ABD0LIH2_9CAEN